MNLFINAKNNIVWDKLMAVVLAVVVALAAIYALYTSNQIYAPLQANNAKYLPKDSRQNGPAELQTMSAHDQSVNNTSSTQLQTGSSSVQQASPNTPQNAGSSNPFDPDYCDRRDYRNFVDCAEPIAP